MKLKQVFKTFFLFSVVALSSWTTCLWAANSKGPYWIEKDEGSKKALQSKVDAMNEMFSSLAATYSSAVVTVLTTSEIKVPQMQMIPEDMFDLFFGFPGGGGIQRRPPRSQKTQSLGSGFVIHPDGIIVTNSHVVRIEDDRLADSVKVKFLGDSDKAEGVDVEIVGVDPLVDTAVLRLKGKVKRNLSVIPLGNSDSLKVGEWVMAIGNPHGLSHTVTKGIVSALGRDIIPNVSADFIQTDASINQGNSGGPLINMMGEVVGINTAIDPRGQGLGFAIPVNTAKRAIKAIMEKGKPSHGFAGVSLFQNFDLETAKSLGLKNADGALIEDVVPGQSAANAGLKAYDVVTKVGDRKINTNSDFQKAVRELDPNTKVSVEYLREGKISTTTMILGDLEKSSQVAFKDIRSLFKGSGGGEKTESVSISRAGFQVVNLTKDIRTRWRLASDVKGVVISEVLANTPADESGIARGDILTEIQKKKVSDVKSVEKAIGKSGTYILKVLRGNTVALFTLKLN
jgi:serine protease Do